MEAAAALVAAVVAPLGMMMIGVKTVVAPSASDEHCPLASPSPHRLPTLRVGRHHNYLFGALAYMDSSMNHATRSLTPSVLLLSRQWKSS